MNTHDKTVSSLLEKILNLDSAQRRLAEAFIDQILACNDPDVVKTFLEWRNDPCIDSLMVVSSALDEEGRDQLLFVAEDLYTDQELSRPVAVAAPKGGHSVPNSHRR